MYQYECGREDRERERERGFVCVCVCVDGADSVYATCGQLLQSTWTGLGLPEGEQAEQGVAGRGMQC